MEYFWIDLSYNAPGNLAAPAASSQAMSGETASHHQGVDIRISKAIGWAAPGDSTTWQISGTKAKAAYRKAEHFQKRQSRYWYSPLGIGWRGYNCANFAEAILKAAGVRRSAGLIFSTPSELAFGKKGGGS